MLGRDFFHAVDLHDDLEWLGGNIGETPADDQVLVRHLKTKSIFSVAVSALADHSWDELFSVLTGARRPRVMTHITRIVGYYSQLQNWNKSKLAELRDRHKGSYGVPDEIHKDVCLDTTPVVPIFATQLESALVAAD